MYKNMKVVGLVAVLFVLLTATLNVQAKSSNAANPPQVSSDGSTVTIYAKSSDRAATEAYWTLARRQAAQPKVFPSNVINSAPANELELGEPNFVGGRLPDPKAMASAKLSFPEEWKVNVNLPLEERTDDYGTAAVYTSYLTNYYSTMRTQYPYGAIGKLYFSGGSYCSASVISPNVIVTAAHCVYDTVNNHWETNWSFVPADRAGAGPYGSFSWSSARVLNGWINAAGTVRNYDVALIKLGTNSAGKNVSYYTGYFGRSWNYGYTLNLHAFGYPSNLNSGYYTYTCTAETFSGGTDVLGMGCDMTYGSSGGPWVRNFAPYNGGYVDSVVSGGTPGTYTFYGPRFSSNNIVVLCGTSTCWP